MDSIKNSIKEKLSSPRAHLALFIIGIVFISLLIFHTGFVMGAHNRFPQPQERAPGWDFQAPGFGPVHLPPAFMEGHGVVGTIEDISTSSLTIQTREGGTKKVLLTSKTQFRNPDGSASSTALSKGTSVMILGAPDANGQVSADVVRIVPQDFLPPHEQPDAPQK
ncbi:MAG: DUF5666 domain-containing protein [Candidatus Kaiserbacteria bacterium]|nr:DUF5666 domain-containing protein [Candidatus Kaiserbacteria bacterium]